MFPKPPIAAPGRVLSMHMMYMLYADIPTVGFSIYVQPPSHSYNLANC